MHRHCVPGPILQGLAGDEARLKYALLTEIILFLSFLRHYITTHFLEMSFITCVMWDRRTCRVLVVVSYLTTHNLM